MVYISYPVDVSRRLPQWSCAGPNISGERTTLPPADLRKLGDLSELLDQHTEPAALLGPGGEQIPLSVEVYDVLIRVVAAMDRQQAVTLAPIDQRLTTQQAADLLGISCPTVIELIDTEELPCEKPSGSRHRRLLLSDVLDYQNRRSAKRDELLAKLVHDVEDDGLCDIPAERFQGAIRQARAERREEP